MKPQVHMTYGGLPEHCFYAPEELPGQLVILTRGVIGYTPCDKFPVSKCAEFNEGLTPGQVAAMIAGSMFGWDIPAADPANYDAEGRPLRATRKLQRNRR